MIRLMCPGCKTVYEVDNSFAGQKVKCHKCQTRFIVPPPPEGDCDHNVGTVSSPVSEEQDKSRHGSTAILQEKTNVKVEKKNNPARKNKFLKYVSGMRMKYIFCAFLIMLAVIVSVLTLNQMSSNESSASDETHDLRTLSTLPQQPKTEKYVEGKATKEPDKHNTSSTGIEQSRTEKYVEGKENKEQDKVNTFSTVIEQPKTEKYVEGKATKEQERINSGNKRNTSENGNTPPIEATTNDGRHVTLNTDGTWQ